MDADGYGLRFDAETNGILSCAFEVLNTLGHGLLEKPYENSLCVEFGLRGIPWIQQPRYDVTYKTVKVGEYVPDLIRVRLRRRGHEGHRTNYRSRAWPDAQLPQDYRPAGRPHSQFQTRPPRMEARHQHHATLELRLSQSVFIRVHPWFS